MKKNNIKNGQINIYLDSEIYSKEAILKCLYWYSASFRTSIELTNDNIFELALIPLPMLSLEKHELENHLFKIERDLSDYNLREITNKETQSIKELIIAKAFSNYDAEMLPPGEISDPVGFRPEISE